MRKITLLILMTCLLSYSILLFSETKNSIKHQYGKIHLLSGHIIEGTDLIVNEERITMNVNKKTREYDIEDVKAIYSGAKKKFSIFGAFTGAVVSAIPGIFVSTNQYTDGGVIVLLLGVVPLSVGVISGLVTPTLKGIEWELIYSK
jgi:hypothetical protein